MYIVRPNGYEPTMSASSVYKPMENLIKIAKSVIELIVLLKTNANNNTYPSQKTFVFMDTSLRRLVVVFRLRL